MKKVGGLFTCSLCPLGGDKFLLVSECKGRIRIDTGTVAEGRITRK